MKRLPKKTDEQREGIFNPVEQNKRHIAVIHDILTAEVVNPAPKLANVIVFSNPKGCGRYPQCKNMVCVYRCAGG